MDVAAQEFYGRALKGSGEVKPDEYFVEGEAKSTDQMIEYYTGLVADFPIVSIEDPLGEDEWADWTAITAAIGDKVQIVGDDHYVTNTSRIHARDRGEVRERPAGQGQPDRLADRDRRGRRGRAPSRASRP